MPKRQFSHDFKAQAHKTHGLIKTRYQPGELGFAAGITFVPVGSFVVALSQIMEGMGMAAETKSDISELRSPKSKLLRFFQRSRNKWKEKYREVKRQRKLLTNQVRAVEKSRAHWRTLAEQHQKRVADLEREMEQLKRANAC